MRPRYHQIRPDSPVADVIAAASVRPAPSGPWTPGFHRWPNVAEAHRRLLAEAVPRLKPPSVRKSGRGIVLYGGGPYLASAFVTIKALRHVGCDLPVEMFYIGPEELDRKSQRIFSQLGVSCVDACEIPEHVLRRSFGGWALKPFALRHTRFAEAIGLDADCYPAGRNVAFLFDSEPYRETKALFLPDSPRTELPDHIWTKIGLPGTRCRPFESGMIVVDTESRWRELALADWICDHSDYYFQLFHGDKEAFSVAWNRLGTPFSMPPYRWCKVEHSLVHYGYDGAPLVVHRCFDKFTLNPERGGRRLFKGTPQHTGPNSFCPDLPLEIEAFGWLQEYRALMR